MITEWFVGFVLGVVVQAMNVLPVVEPAPTFNIGPIIGMAKGWNAALPITEMIAGIVILLAVTSASFIFALLRQVWRFVPVIGGG